MNTGLWAFALGSALQYRSYFDMGKSMRSVWILIIFFAAGVGIGCSSTPPLHPKETTMLLPEYDDLNEARGEAFAASAMHFRKPMPSRPDWRPMEFYFKHCQDLGYGSHYSATSYQCSSP